MYSQYSPTSNYIRSLSLKLLFRTALLATRDDRDRFIKTNPILLRPSVQATLVETLSREIIPFNIWKTAKRTLWKSALDFLTETRHEYETFSPRYEGGVGPIERLVAGVESGELQLAQAMQQSGQITVWAHLAPVYVFWLSETAVAISRKGNWRRASNLQRILLASIEKDESSEARENADVAETDWVEIAITALSDVPDARLLREARNAGDRVVARTTENDPKSWHALTLHRLGVLHFDPYVRDRDAINYSRQERLWRDRFILEHGPSSAKLPESEWRMPPINEALNIAEVYLHRAIEKRTGHEKALSLKVLVQLLEWRSWFGGSVDHAEIVRLCNQALHLLNSNGAPQHRLFLIKVLTHHGALTADISKELHFHFDSLLPYINVDALLQYAELNLVTPHEVAADAFRTLANAGDLFAEWATEGQQVRRRDLLALLFCPTFAPGLMNGKITGSWTDRVRSVSELSNTGVLRGTELACCKIWLAAHSGAEDQEAQGLEFLSEACGLDPSIETNYGEMLGQLRANLLFGVGANCANTGKFKPSVTAYIGSLTWALHFGVRESANEIVKRIYELLLVGSDSVAEDVFVGMATCTLDYEELCGIDAMYKIQTLWHQLSAIFFTRLSTQPALLSLLLQCAKGLRFSYLLSNPLRQVISEDSVLATLLARTKMIENDISYAGATVDDTIESTFSAGGELPIDAETVMLSYVKSADPQPGSTPHVLLRNVQQRFDAELHQRLLKAPGSHAALPKDIDTIRAELDDRTVLIDYYCGKSEDEKLAVYMLVYTKQELFAGRIGHEYPHEAHIVDLQRGCGQLLFSALAPVVRLFRLGVQRDPDDDSVIDQETRYELEKWFDGFVGEIGQTFKKLRDSGKDHLCIVPHGPLHYFPFHLLSQGGVDLAEHWIVTYLPSLSLLFRKPAKRRTGLSSIGISFSSQDKRGLRPIPQAVDEASDIAAVFDVPAMVEGQATKPNVLDALRTSAYVHIATHGEQNEFAPAFHCIELYPDDSGEDRLYAYEIEQLDLGGIEVVTLGACDTALGRFDPGDNLRGLPASFLITGASTLIGTLWETETNACKTFFVNLYESLRSGMGKLDAFRSAQMVTRRDHPEDRDWGAFYFSGDWR
jgi:hypothetical protein